MPLADLFKRFMGRVEPQCSHLDQVRPVEARTAGCEECLGIGETWVELRLCLACGHVGCCDNSPKRHARAHFVETNHAVIRADLPGYSWNWCWIDEIKV